MFADLNVGTRLALASGAVLLPPDEAQFAKFS